MNQLPHPKICLILGDPVSHSLSPVMHRAGYHATGLTDQFCFSSAQINTAQLPEALAAIKLLKIRGAACTMPLKEAIVPLLDWLDPHASTIGAVNTLVYEEGIIKGYNTDWLGIAVPLQDIRTLHSKEALVLGAGGAARAAIYALKSLGMRVTLCNRTLDKAQQLSTQFSCQTLDWSERQESKNWDVIINTTSVGMAETVGQSPLPKYSFKEHQIVFETIYSPRETALITMAQEKRAIALRGIDMLLNQGIAQFEIFTGHAAPVEAMRKALGD